MNPVPKGESRVVSNHEENAMKKSVELDQSRKRGFPVFRKRTDNITK